MSNIINNYYQSQYVEQHCTFISISLTQYFNILFYDIDFIIIHFTYRNLNIKKNFDENATQLQSISSINERFYYEVFKNSSDFCDFLSK